MRHLLSCWCGTVICADTAWVTDKAIATAARASGLLTRMIRKRLSSAGDKPASELAVAIQTMWRASSRISAQRSLCALAVTGCNLGNLEPTQRDALMLATEVGAVWGVGRRIGAQLKEAGIHTVLDLARLDPVMVKRRWSVVLERTVRELQGTDCMGLEHEPPAKQEIACTRSFGHAVMDLSALQEAVTEFASRAAQ